MSIKDPYGCGECGLKFSSLDIFDRHRVGEYVDVHPDYGRSCLTNDDLGALGYNLVRGVWTTTTEEKYATKVKAVRRRFLGDKSRSSPH